MSLCCKAYLKNNVKIVAMTTLTKIVMITVKVMVIVMVVLMAIVTETVIGMTLAIPIVMTNARTKATVIVTPRGSQLRSLFLYRDSWWRDFLNTLKISVRQY